MGIISDPRPALLLVAASSRYQAALDWSRKLATERWGPVAARSPPLAFVETDYYQQEMGDDLLKQFWVHRRLVDPAVLPEVKHQTNQWEAEYAGLGAHPEPRPLNLDPGYLTLAKLVLASTKDHAHRLYLGGGIYGEVTLQYRGRRWQAMPWTYPDYLRSEYHQFFSEAREHLRQGQ